jgi:hypothetical protein
MNSRRKFLTVGGGAVVSAFALTGIPTFGSSQEAQFASFEMQSSSGSLQKCRVRDVAQFHQDIGKFADEGTPIFAHGNTLTLTRKGKPLKLQLEISDRSLRA